MVYFMVRHVSSWGWKAGGGLNVCCCSSSISRGLPLGCPWARLGDVFHALLARTQVGFDVSARVLVFWTVMFVAGVFGLTLFMLVALPAKTITVAAAIQVGGAGAGLPARS
jgi:hypothetical protein